MMIGRIKKTNYHASTIKVFSGKNVKHEHDILT